MSGTPEDVIGHVGLRPVPAIMSKSGDTLGVSADILMIIREGGGRAVPGGGCGSAGG
jgi:hypothetical protein